MTITTAQNLSGGAWDGSGAGGSVATAGNSAPPSAASPAGFIASISGTNPTTSTIGAPGGIVTTATGFDPVAVAALQVVLPSTGWIWPVGIN